MTKASHYTLGFLDVKHKGKVTKTSVGSKEADKLITIMDKAYEYEVAYVPAGYANRPDLISDIFYDTAANWWLILLANNIPDPFEGLNVGDRILIPKV